MHLQNQNKCKESYHISSWGSNSGTPPHTYIMQCPQCIQNKYKIEANSQMEITKVLK